MSTGTSTYNLRRKTVNQNQIRAPAAAQPAITVANSAQPASSQNTEALSMGSALTSLPPTPPAAAAPKPKKPEDPASSDESVSYADITKRNGEGLLTSTPKKQGVEKDGDNREEEGKGGENAYEDDGWKPAPKRKRSRSPVDSPNASFLKTGNRYQSLAAAGSSKHSDEKRDQPPHMPQDKGKVTDLRNYGDLNIDPDDLDPQKQREAFANYELIKKIVDEAIRDNSVQNSAAGTSGTSKETDEKVAREEALENKIDAIEKDTPEPKRRPSKKKHRHSSTPAYNLAAYSNNDASIKGERDRHPLQPSSQLPDTNPIGQRIKKSERSRKGKNERTNPDPGGDEPSDPNGNGGDDSDGGSSDGFNSDSDSSSQEDTSSGKSSTKKKDKKIRIKPVPPQEYDGTPDEEVFLSFMEEAEGYFEDGNVPKKSRMRILSRFLRGDARTFYQQQVRTTKPEKWSLSKFFRELFDYCFPSSYRDQLQLRMERCTQGPRTVKVFAAELLKFSAMLDFKDDKQLVRRLWTGLRMDIQKELYLKGLEPSSSSFGAVVEAAEIAERALNLTRNGMFRNHSNNYDNSPRNHQPYRNNRRQRNNFRNSDFRNNRNNSDRQNNFNRNNNGQFSSNNSNNDRNAPRSDNRQRTPFRNNNNNNRGRPNNRGQRWGSNSSRNNQYSGKKLSDQEKKQYMTDGKCFKCGQTGHFSRNCPQNRQFKSNRENKPPGVVFAGVGVDIDDPSAEFDDERGDFHDDHGEFDDDYGDFDNDEDLENLAETTEVINAISIGAVGLADEDEDNEDDLEDEDYDEIYLEEEEKIPYSPDEAQETWKTGLMFRGDKIDRCVDRFSHLFHIGDWLARRVTNILEAHADLDISDRLDVFPDQGVLEYDDLEHRFVAERLDTGDEDDEVVYLVEDLRDGIEALYTMSELENPEFDVMRRWNEVRGLGFDENHLPEKMGNVYAEGVAYHVSRFAEMVRDMFEEEDCDLVRECRGRPNIHARMETSSNEPCVRIYTYDTPYDYHISVSRLRDPSFNLMQELATLIRMCRNELEAIMDQGLWYREDPLDPDGAVRDSCDQDDHEYDPDYPEESDSPESYDSDYALGLATHLDKNDLRVVMEDDDMYYLDSEEPHLPGLEEDESEDEEDDARSTTSSMVTQYSETAACHNCKHHPRRPCPAGDPPEYDGEYCALPLVLGAQIPKGSFAAAERNAAVVKDFRRQLPKPIVVVVEVNGHPAKALIDSGCLVDLMSTTLADQIGIKKIVLKRPLPLQLAVKGSRARINYGAKAMLGYQKTLSERYFDIANLVNYDLILGTPFIFQHQVKIGLNPPTVQIGSEKPLPLIGDGVAMLAVASETVEVYESNLEQIRKHLTSYAAPICKDPSETPLPPLREINHHIPIVDKLKRYPWRPSRCPEPLKEEWKKKKDVYLKNGRWEITTASNTVPLLCLQKVRKPGEQSIRLRTVVDLRTRNANTVKMASPLPDIESILRRVAQHKFRTLLDGKDMFECIRIVPEDVPYSAMTTPDGNMVSHVIQQGDVNGPATCQALMHHLMGSRLGRFVDVYLDDIVIYSNNLKDHIKHVKEIIDVLRKAEIYLNANKLNILPKELHILGHVIDDNGIRMDPDKVDSIVKWKIPTNRDLLRGFLGSVGYLADNIAKVRIPMAVLHAVTGDSVPFRWGPTEQRAFDEIKRAAQACRDHARKPLDYSKGAPSINMVTDGCATGIAGVISQGEDWKTAKVAAFYSAKLNSAQQNYPVHEIEMLAGVETMLRHRDILQGAHFKWYTDHKGLIHLLNQKNLSGRQARWIEKISEFDFEVIYVPGSENVLSDALSRIYSNDSPGTVRAVSEYTQHDEEFFNQKLGNHAISMPVFVGMEAMGLSLRAKAQRKRRAREAAQKAKQTEKPPKYTQNDAFETRERRQEGGSTIPFQETQNLTLDSSETTLNQDDSIPESVPPLEEQVEDQERVESSTESTPFQAERATTEDPEELENVLRAPPSTPTNQDWVKILGSNSNANNRDVPDLDLGGSGDPRNPGNDRSGSRPSGDSDKENVPPPSNNNLPPQNSQRRARKSGLHRLDDFNLLKNSQNAYRKGSIERLVRNKYTLDPFFRKVLDRPKDYQNFKANDGLIHLKTAEGIVLCIPDILEDGRRVRELVISEGHSILAHLGARKVYNYLRDYVWWKDMSVDIKKYCESCQTCKRSKPSNQKPYGLLNPLDIPSQPWEAIGIDFVGPLPWSKDRNGTYDSITVVIDLLTAMVHLLPSRTSHTSKDVAELVFAEVYKHHGMPKSIVSDRDVVLRSQFWTHLNQLIGIDPRMSSAYHPQSDGATERANRTVVQMLRCCIGPDQTDWVRHLPAIEFAINLSRSESTGFAPFFLNTGRMPRAMIWENKTETAFPGVRQYAQEMKQAIMRAHDNIIAARVKQVRDANRRRVPAPFAVGDLVYVSTKNLAIPQGLARKLVPKYIGPYRINVDYGNNSFLIDLPPRLKQRGIHPTFNAEYLRIHVPNDDRLFPGRDITQITELGGTDNEWAIDQILSHFGSGTRSIFETRWKAGDITWLDYPKLRNHPVLHEYLEAMGANNISQLQKGKATPPEDVRTLFALD